MTRNKYCLSEKKVKTLKCYDFLSTLAVTLSINIYQHITQHGEALTRTLLTLLHSSSQDYGHGSVFFLDVYSWLYHP